MQNKKIWTTFRVVAIFPLEYYNCKNFSVKIWLNCLMDSGKSDRHCTSEI